MTKEFAKEIVEHYEGLKSVGIQEDAANDQYTDATLALNQPKYNTALITKVYAEMIATNFYETGVMTGPVEKTPVEIYDRQAGVTTTAVDEGGVISQGRTSYSSVTIEAVGYKLKSVLTAEAIEDAQNAGNINIVARAIANLSKDIQREVDGALMNLMVAGAAAGNVDITKGANDAKTIGNMITEAVVDSIQNVKRKNYRPDFLLVDPNFFGYIAKTDEFVHASLYGSDQLQQTGFLGRIRGLDVFESNNMPANKAVVGKKQTFGIYKVYIPMMFRGPVYDPNLDKETYVVRQRAAMKITVGESLATLTLL